MYFTRVGFEQATDQWIARYKAERFANREVADLCCGIGGDAIGLAATASQLTLYDRAAQAVEFSRRNVHLYAGDRIPITAAVKDVATLAVATVDAWHIDPDRRPRGGRTTQAELHEPADTTIDLLLAQNANAAIKLAPACEVPARWSDHGELEWISRDGECKQLVVWLGDLAQAAGSRRATLLRAGSHKHEYDVAKTLVGAEVELSHGESIDEYVYEPDAAILASGLVGALAREHRWRTFASTSGYLTGSQRVDEAACTAFEVVDVLPLQTKKISRYLRERGIGRVEIKHRSIDVSPEKLRREWKLAGDNRATLLLTRVGEKRIAIVANRVERKAEVVHPSHESSSHSET